MNENLALYVLMRTDMESLTPGKAMAQACHAGGQFQKVHGHTKLFKEWASQADGFGTTIVLDVFGEASLDAVMEKASALGFPCGLVTDSTYPVEDGVVVHHLPVITCGYILIDRSRNEDRDVVADLGLLSKRYAKPEGK